MSLGTLGKYERIGILGRGVSGIVYLAKDTLLNKQVALKEVDVQAGDLRRFLEEARVMDRLRHPNIVRVNGVDRIEDKVVIDMEYVRGSNLQEALRAEGLLCVDKALDITIQVLNALEYAHSMQTVHRDIKPANILLQKDGVIKLADFGLAEILATNAYVCGAGTYAYMAPEDFEEESHSDAQSDIWAVAVTLFEMMTGERPFEVTNPKSPFAWKRALESQTPRSVSSIIEGASSGLDAAVARGLARSKELRYQTAGEFRDELVRVRRSEAEAGRSLERPDRYGEPDWGSPAPGRTAVVESTAGRRRQISSPGDATDTVVSASGGIEIDARGQPDQRRRMFGFLRRQRDATLVVSPRALDFGAIRSGDARELKVNVRIAHLQGASHGRVVSAPDWVTVQPTDFEAQRQTLTVTVQSDLAPSLGVVDASICIETRAGVAAVPIRVTILKPRPSFRQIAVWYLPLFGLALTPAAIAAAAGAGNQALSPPAAVSSMALGLMLLLVTAGVDGGIIERMACGVLMACMCVVLGTSVAAHQQAGYTGPLGHGLELAAGAGFGFGLILIVQLLTLKRWRFWAFALAFLGLLLGSVCYNAALA